MENYFARLLILGLSLVNLVACGNLNAPSFQQSQISNEKLHSSLDTAEVVPQVNEAPEVEADNEPTYQTSTNSTCAFQVVNTYELARIYGVYLRSQVPVDSCGTTSTSPYVRATVGNDTRLFRKRNVRALLDDNTEGFYNYLTQQNDLLYFDGTIGCTGFNKLTYHTTRVYAKRCRTF